MKAAVYRDMLHALRLTQAGNVGSATSFLLGRLRSARRPSGPPARPDRAPVLGLVELGSPNIDARAGARPHPGRTVSATFANAAGSRSYQVYIPRSYDGRPCPLIVMLHGCTQSAADFAAGTRMNVIADELSFVVAYPEQAASANGARCWNWFNRRDQQRDLGEPSIVAGIARRIAQDYAIDRSRVYVAGLSAGAAAAAVLGQTYPDIFAAIGVHSGLACGMAHDVRTAFAAMRSGKAPSQPNGVPPAPHGRRAIPTIVFHGDRDATVHPSNGARFAQDAAFAASVPEVRAGQSGAGRSYTHSTYTDADGRPALEEWIVHGAGHAWSGGSKAGSFTDPLGPDASREMVRFFLSQRLAH